MQNEELRLAQDALEQSRDRYARLFERSAGRLRHPQLRRCASFEPIAPRQRCCAPGGLKRWSDGGSHCSCATTTCRLFQRALARVLQRQGPQTVELRLHNEGSAPVWATMEMALTAAEDGAASCHVAISDIGERVRLQESRARLAALVESSDDAIVGRDLDGIVTSWNHAAERLFGLSAEQALGLTMDGLVPATRHGEETDLLRRLRRGEHIHHFESERIVRDGSPRALSISLSPVRNGQGQVTGSAMIARDVSQRRRAEEALSQRLRQLEMLSHAGQSLIMGELAELPLRGDLFERVREAVGCDVHMIYTLDDDRHHAALALFARPAGADAGPAELGADRGFAIRPGRATQGPPGGERPATQRRAGGARVARGGGALLRRLPAAGARPGLWRCRLRLDHLRPLPRQRRAWSYAPCATRCRRCSSARG